jgi:hypothetical protein
MREVIDSAIMFISHPALLVVVLPVAWCGVSWFFSFITGWQLLASRYRARVGPDVKPLQAVRANWGSPLLGGNVYVLAATAQGLYLGVLFPFRIGHPPLLIPWRDVRAERFQGPLRTDVRLWLGENRPRQFLLELRDAEKLREQSQGQLVW